MNKYYVLVLLILYGCANGAYVKRGTTTLPPVVQASGVEQYLLAPLPWWANYSTSGKCFRDLPVRYFDLPKLKASYSMDYMPLLYWQVVFNKSVAKELGTINLAKEEELFQTTYAQIKGEVKSIYLPEHDRFHLVWVDHFWDDKEHLEKLKQLMAQEDFFKGVPVMISTCLSSWQLEKEWTGNGLKADGIFFLGSEYFSPYDSAGVQRPYISFDFGQLIPKDKTVYFYSLQELLPTDFSGSWTVKKY